MKVQKRRGIIAAAVIATAAAGSWIPSVAEQAKSSATAIPASVIQTLKTGTHAQQKAALEHLTPAQLTSVMTAVNFVTSTGVHFTASSASVSPTQDVATAEEITPVGAPTVSADPVGDVNRTKNCGSRWTYVQYWVDAQDAFGLRLYRWHDDIEWFYNCQVITNDFYHYAYATDMLPPFETWKSTVQDTMTKAGAPTGIATGQGEMAACVGFSFFSGCFDNSAPYIQISYDAFGNSRMTGYGT